MTAYDEIKPDAGTKAREKVKNRKSVAQRAVVIWNFLLLTVVLCVIGLGSVLYYKVSKTPKVYQVDSRPCEYTDEKTGITLTGTRYYSYYQQDLFGFQWRDGKAVDETTELDLTGSAMTIMGVGNGQWWYKYIDDGETGLERMKSAELYQFVIGKRAVAVPYRKFCR